MVCDVCMFGGNPGIFFIIWNLLGCMEVLVWLYIIFCLTRQELFRLRTGFRFQPRA